MLNNILSFLNNGLLSLPHWWSYILVVLILTHITISSVTIYLHRHQSHRALDLHPIASHLFRWWLWLTTGMVTKEWVSIHRKHHAKVETYDDPHSPQVNGISTVFFKGSELYRKESQNKETLEKYGIGTPNDWLENNIYSKYVWQGVGLMLMIDLLLFGVIGLTVWAVQMLWIPVMAAGVVNGIGHYWGYRRHASEDSSTNIVPWGILIGGEELHNNHHAFVTSAKLSSTWYEFDIGWLYIKLLSYLRLAKIRKIMPTRKFSKHKILIDLKTLQSIINHRFTVTKEYHKLETKFQHTRFIGSKILNMGSKLSLLWERSNETSEQLLHRLQDWCIEAEESGIPQLKQFSLRLRSYC